MKLSTRNQLAGSVTEVTAGEAMAVVKVALEGGDTITSSITRKAAEGLGLETGKKVIVLIKATEVGIAVED